MSESVGRLGCLVFVLAPALGAVLYPRANWLFLVPVALIGIVVVIGYFSKSRDAAAVAELAERLLDAPRDWDVDDYEVRTCDRKLQALVVKTFSIGGRPENWVSLEESKKEEIRALIREMRGLSKKSE